jgi:hypothetical protein
MGLRPETNWQSDLDNRHRSVPQQLFRTLNSSPQEKLMRPQACRLPELGREVHSTQSCNNSQIRRGDICWGIIIDVFDDPFEPPLLQCPDLPLPGLYFIRGGGSSRFRPQPMIAWFKLTAIDR